MRFCRVWGGCLAGFLIFVAHQTHAAEPVPSLTEDSPFATEIYTFLVEDQVMGIPPCRTLFVGSSSIRFWFTLQSDFADREIVRRGFGGAQLEHVIMYFDLVVTPHRPRSIVLYGGENDIYADKTPQNVLDDLQTLMSLKSRRLGDVPVYFISIKPSKARFGQLELQAEANQLVRRLADQRDDLFFVNVVPAMMEDGAPKDIFIDDDLHMNLDGYDLWTKAVQNAFARHGDPKASACH